MTLSRMIKFGDFDNLYDSDINQQNSWIYLFKKKIRLKKHQNNSSEGFFLDDNEDIKVYEAHEIFKWDQDPYLRELSVDSLGDKKISYLEFIENKYCISHSFLKSSSSINVE